VLILLYSHYTLNFKILLY